MNIWKIIYDPDTYQNTLCARVEGDMGNWPDFKDRFLTKKIFIFIMLNSL